MRLNDLCPFCEGPHAPQWCAAAAGSSPWELAEGAESAAATGHPDALADLLVYRFHAPLRAAVARIEEEAHLLSGLYRDLDQDRRYSLDLGLLAAVAALRKGDLALAREELTAVQSRGGEDPKASLLNGFMHLREGALEAARESFEAATLRTDPGPARAHLRFLQGRCLLVQGEVPKARDRFQKALDESVPPLRAELLYQLARLKLAFPAPPPLKGISP